MSTETLRSFRDLLKWLAEQRAPHQADLALQLVEMPAQSAPLDDVVYVRWERALPYVQLVVPTVRNVMRERMTDVLEALGRLNDTLPWVAFGFEWGRRFIYARRCLPVYAEEGLPPSWFDSELKVLLKLARDNLRPLRQVVAGAPGASILELVEKEQSLTSS